MAPSVVLVTGASRYLGGHLTARLAADPGVERVLGVDTVPPPPDLHRRMGRAEFLLADVRGPLVGKVISSARVDTVVHASLRADPASPRGGSTTGELNVVGALQLLSACQRTPSVRRLVIKSTSAVYGAGPRAPAMFTEEMEPRALPPGGYAQDAAEIEGGVRGFARRRPDVAVTVLRFTNVVGPRIETALTRYFALPVAPTVFGSDVRLQLLHEEDAVAVLQRAARSGPPGVFNVGADGVLLLSQALRRAGRLPVSVPEPAVPALGRLLRAVGLPSLSPGQLRLLDFGRVVDTTRLRTEFGFTPRFSTERAFADFVRGQALRPLVDPARLAGVEAGLLAAARALR